MDLYLAGAESPAHLSMLRANDAPRVGVNITNLSRKVKGLEKWASEERLGGMDWVLYADSPTTPWEPVLAVLTSAEVQPSLIIGPSSWADETQLGENENYVPIWDGHDNRLLRDLLERYQGVFLPDSVVDNATACRTAVAAANSGMLVGAITGRTKGLDQFGLVVSSGWWAVQKHGETQVWDRGKLHRYNSNDKHAKRMAHQQAIEELGVDFDAVLTDDSVATTTLAIRSWLMFERALDQRLPASVRAEVDSPLLTDMPVQGSATVAIAKETAQGRHAVLPVVGLEHVQVTRKDLDGADVTDHSEVLAVNTKSLRKCDSCQFSIQCPSFQMGEDCAYHIPVIIRSKDQLQDVLRAMVEVQTQRVLMSRFGEEITGTSDPDVGREMDRLFNMVQKWKDIEDNRDTLEVSVKAKGDMGRLSRLFGAKVGSNARMLDIPVSSDQIIEEMSGA